MSDFKCCNLTENEYGESVCRYTNCPCDCSSRDECVFSPCFDNIPSDFD